MSPWALVPAPRSAASYCQSVLAEGAELAKAITARCNFDEGQLRALLPEGVGLPDDCSYQESIRNFAPDLGALHASSRLALSRLVQELEPASTSTVVIEDSIARPGDPALSRCGVGVVIRNGHVYHVWPSEKLSADTLADRIKQVSTWPVGILAKCRIQRPPGVELLEGGVLQSVLSGGRFSCVAIAAFDDESFIVWTPSP